MGFLYGRKLPDIYSRLRIVKQRSALSSEDEKYMNVLWNGHLGEMAVDQWLEAIPGLEAMVIPDLRLEIDRRIVQLDTVLLTDQRMYILEIKHFRGEYECTDANQWRSPGGQEIQSPFLQLERSVSLVKRYLRDEGLGHIHVEGWVICPHESFHLYNMSKNQPVITGARWLSFLQHGLKDWHLKPTASAERIYQKLLKTRPAVSPYVEKDMPGMNDLRMGIYCEYCYSLMKRKRGSKLLCCPKCNTIVDSASAVYQAKEELRLMNTPDAITPSKVYEWTGGLLHRRTIERHMQ